VSVWRRIKTGLRALVPPSVVTARRRRRIERDRARDAGKSPREIFTAIYREGRWGGTAGAFHSGSGSGVEHADRYAEAVKSFIRERGVRSVVDLGCGDFRVGARLLDVNVDYIGVDVVEDLVRRNQAEHGGARVRFRCLDAIEEPPPPADLCLVRQVLQHLSNAQIASVLANLGRFRYVLVTEHYPSPSLARTPNLDKPCGADVRIYDGSAVELDRPPFNVRVTGMLLDEPADHCLVAPGERLKTLLVEPPRAPQPELSVPSDAHRV
jgi:SAM-dependent methyltransferase